MKKSGVSKRNITICTTMSERDWAEFEAAAKKLWSGIEVSRSSKMLFFAKKGGMAQVRNVIVAGKDARATVVEGYFGGKDAYWTNVVNQVFLEPGAHVALWLPNRREFLG